MTDVIGSAFIDIRARVSNFETQVAAETKAAMGAAAAETRVGAGAVTREAKTAEQGIVSAFTSAGTRSSSTIKSSMRDIGSAAGIPAGMFKLAIPAAIAATTVAAIKMASTFQRSMEMIHTQAGASQQEVDRLSQSVLGLAGKTAQAPDALAAGLYHIESAGFRGAQALDLVTASAKGATIGQADLESTTQAMIAAVASGIGGVRNASDAMATLTRTVGIGDMRMEGLAQAMSTGILPSARSAGLSLQDVSAALATITDNATPPVEAATRLRMTFSLLSAPTQTAQKALAGIGITSTQLGRDMRQPDGLLKAVMDLKTHLQDSGKTAVEQNAVIAQAFGGGRTSGSILTLLEESDRLKSKYEELGTAASRAAGFQEAWTKTQQTFGVEWHTLTAVVDAFMIRLGTGLLPVATKVVHFFAVSGPSAISGFAHAMTSITGGMLTSGFNSLSSTIGHIASTIGHLISIAAPVAKGLAAIAGTVVITAFDGLAHALQGVTAALDAVTGFFAHNQIAASALAGVLAGALLPVIWDAVAAFGAWLAMGIVTMITGIIEAVMEMVGAFSAADGAVAGFSAALLSLDLNPVGVALAAVGLAVGGLIALFHSGSSATDNARKSVDAYVKSLDINYNSVQQVAAAETSLNNRIAARTALIKNANLAQLEQLSPHPVAGRGDQNGSTVDITARVRAGLLKTDPLLNQYKAHLASVEHQSVLAGQRTAELSSTLGVNQTAVRSAANALGLNLTDAYAKLEPRIANYIATARLSHHPTAQASADFADLGNKANDVTTDIQRLDSAWNNLVGNFVGMKQAQLGARQAFDALTAALHKSNNSLKLNTQAGQDARGALLAMPDVIKQVIDSTYQQTGSYAKAAAAGQHWLDRIKASKAAGPIVKNITDGISRDLQGLASVSGPAGTKASQGFANGIGSASGSAAAKARQLVSNAAAAMNKAKEAAIVAGENFSSGFAAGMSHSAFMAFNEARAIGLISAQNARNALQQKSPSRVMMRVGFDFGHGFALGIRSTRGAVGAAATDLGLVAWSATANAARHRGHVDHLGALVGSPTKHAKDIITDLVKGVGDNSPRFQTAVGNLLSNLDGQVASHNQKTQAAGKKLMSALITGLGDEKTRLGAVISSVKSQLSTLEQSSKSLRSSIVSSIGGQGDITQLQSGDVSARSMISFLHTNQRAVDEFQKNLHTLARRGVSQRIVNQLAQAGIGQGSMEAASLAHASRRQISQIDSISGSIERTARQIGGTEANRTFGKQIDRVSGRLGDLNVAMHALTQVINKQNNRVKLAPTDHAPTKSSTSSSTTTTTASHPGQHHRHHHKHHAGTHDRGGWLAPGVHGDVVNATNRPEAVMPQDVMAEAIARSVREALAGLLAGGHGTHHGPLIGQAHFHNPSDADATLRRLEFLIGGSTV